MHLEHVGLHALQLLLSFLALGEDLVSGNASVVQLPHNIFHLSLKTEKRGN